MICGIMVVPRLLRHHNLIIFRVPKAESMPGPKHRREGQVGTKSGSISSKVHLLHPM